MCDVMLCKSDDVIMSLTLQKDELSYSGGPAETRPNRATKLTASVFSVAYCQN